jgi:hypothetical protein
MNRQFHLGANLHGLHGFHLNVHVEALVGRPASRVEDPESYRVERSSELNTLNFGF